MAVVLVAEDNADLRELTSVILRQAGHEVVAVPTGAEAHETALARRPQLAVLDIAMPGELDGLDVARLLRRDPRTSGMGIILLTAFGRDEDVRLGMAAGADEYLVKPFDVRRFLDVVARLLEKRGTEPSP